MVWVGGGGAELDGLFNLLHSKWAKLHTWSFAHSECNKNLQIYEINKSEYVPFKKYNSLGSVSLEQVWNHILSSSNCKMHQLILGKIYKSASR